MSDDRRDGEIREGFPAPLDDTVLARLLQVASDPDTTEPLPDLDDDRYRLVREIGRGGMGVVFEADDLRLHRTVALKVLSTSAAWDLQARQRFAREALTAARLQHPHIAAIYDATPDFIAMQRLHGLTLCEMDRSDAARVVRVARDAAEAVQYAHERGIIHRDLKPANLMVENADGDQPHVFVMDFGLAKEIAVDSSLSLSGYVLGTPSYMSPEQALGRGDQVDERSDVYSLGATLYAALAGAPPFGATGDALAVLERVVHVEPTGLRRARPGLDVDLETVVHKAMAKDRSERYRSAQEFADDLGRWLRSEPIRARPPSVLYRVRRFARRRAGALQAVAVSVLAVALFAVILVMAERGEREGAEQALRLSSSVAALERDAADAFLAGDLSVRDDKLRQAVAACREFVARRDSAHGHYLLGRLLLQLKDHEQALTALDRALALDPDLDEARFVRGLTFLDHSARKADSGGPESLVAGHLLEQARLDLKVHERSTLKFRRVDVLYGEARLAMLDGDRDKARDNLAAIVYRLDPYHVEARQCLAELTHDEDPDEAIRLASRALDLESGRGSRGRDLDGGGGPPAAPVIGDGVVYPAPPVEGDGIAVSLECMQRARDLYLQGDVEGALAEWRRAIATADATLASTPRSAAARNNRGVARAAEERVLVAQGKMAAAVVARMTALEDFEAAVELDPSAATPRLNRAATLSRVAQQMEVGGLADDASATRGRALEDYQRALERLDPASPLRDGIEAAMTSLRRSDGSVR